MVIRSTARTRRRRRRKRQRLLRNSRMYSAAQTMGRRGRDTVDAKGVEPVGRPGGRGRTGGKAGDASATVRSARHRRLSDQTGTLLPVFRRDYPTGRVVHTDNKLECHEYREHSYNHSDMNSETPLSAVLNGSDQSRPLGKTRPGRFF